MNKLLLQILSFVLFLIFVLLMLAPAFTYIKDCTNEPPIPEGELLHPEGYTFPLEENEELERSSAPLFFDFFKNLWYNIFINERRK